MSRVKISIGAADEMFGMRTKQLGPLTFALVFGALACSGSDAAVSRTAEIESPTTSLELIEQFTDAHLANDLEGILRLVYWAGADAQHKAVFEDAVQADLGRPIAKVHVAELDADQTLEYTRDGVVYRPNLPPIGWLHVEFEEMRDGIIGASYLVGIEDGVYVLVTAAPVSDS